MPRRGTGSTEESPEYKGPRAGNVQPKTGRRANPPRQLREAPRLWRLHARRTRTHQHTTPPHAARRTPHFIVAQVNLGLSGKTITSQLSAVAFIHKLSGFPDPTWHFVIKNLLVGAAKINSTTDTRLPILKPLLNKLVCSAPYVSDSSYKTCMLKAMYLLAFHAFLRPSEFTSHNRSNPHVLSTSNLKLVYNRSKYPQSPLFVFPDSQPVTRAYFKTQLDKRLSWASLSTLQYKPHSFRIGAATQSALSAVPDHKIKLMGRWHSDAYKKYIRVPML